VSAERAPGRVERLDAAAATRELPALVALLRDSVDGGASVGFLPPLGADEAAAYWRGVIADVAAGGRVLLALREADGRLAGSAQLELAGKPNARHRAEVQKVMVLTAARQRGHGRALMLALEDDARRRGRTTLVLDTREGDPSERLYRAVGWRLAGVVPRYAKSAGGGLDGSAFYYKLLDGA
jgi:ribosomal protein S18 acetylase RimI-like enzyme